jgi:carboxypeptidase C (cathepsin A)
MQENGPISYDDDTNEITMNDQSWNQNANVLYIESPAGVGYSLAGTKADTIHNDMSTSVDAIAALQQWYGKFEEYKENKLFISGESYGGIYVPYLAW